RGYTACGWVWLPEDPAHELLLVVHWRLPGGRAVAAAGQPQGASAGANGGVVREGVPAALGGGGREAGGQAAVPAGGGPGADVAGAAAAAGAGGVGVLVAEPVGGGAVRAAAAGAAGPPLAPAQGGDVPVQLDRPDGPRPLAPTPLLPHV